MRTAPAVVLPQPPVLSLSLSCQPSALSETRVFLRDERETHRPALHPICTNTICPK